MKNLRLMIAVLTLTVVGSGAVPVCAQQADGEAPSRMSAADRAMVTSRTAELNEAAKIYGYNLAIGNWSLRHAPCPALPGAILLHYRRSFPDGAESLFTAVVPRSGGRVRIVPVLYHNATPFVQAAANPRNYALFNQLVQADAGGKTPAGNRVQLSACYAELTGIDAGPLPHRRMGIAAAPAPTIHLEPQSKISRVTLATRANPDTYQVWSVSFNQKGRVVSVATEDQPARPEKPAPRAIAQNRVPHQAAMVPAPSVEPGWRYVPTPPDPPSKFVPSAPPPREKTMPN